MKPSRLFLYLFLILAAALCYSLYTGDPMVGTLTLAGVLPAGAWGDVKNKIGGIVAFKWKAINAARSYVIPSNPRTDDQLIQRARMRQSVFIARQLLGALLKPYWDPFYSTMSGFNKWISYNIMLLTTTDYYLLATSIMSRGSALGVDTLASTYTPGTGAVDITWTDNSNGTTGLITDLAYVIVATKDGKILYAALTADERQDAASSVTVLTGLTPADLFTYVFFTRGTGASLELSDNSGIVNS